MSDPAPPKPATTAGKGRPAKAKPDGAAAKEAAVTLRNPPVTPAVAPTADTLKLNFEMTKQVMATTAVVIPLLLLFLKSDAQSHPPMLAKYAMAALLASLVFGMLSMGRLVSNAEEGRLASLEAGARIVSWLQHLCFLGGMGLIGWLLLNA